MNGRLPEWREPATRTVALPDGYSDEDGMWTAIAAAKHARACGMRPFGSVIVDEEGRILAIASGSETPINPTRHSELLAIKQACQARGGLLQGCTLFQSFEPCHMCCGAIKHAKLSWVVIGSTRADLPSLFRQCDIKSEQLLADTTHPPTVIYGVLKEECLALFAQELVPADSVAIDGRSGR